MSTKKPSEQTPAELGTIWEVPDPLWDKFVAPILADFDPPKKMGRPRADQRRCLDGIIHRARTGCHWNQLPEKFGDDATVHRTLQRWESLGIFDRLWALLIYHCEELGAVHWDWQAADGCLNKARFIGKRGRSIPPHKHQGKTPNPAKKANTSRSRPRTRPKTARSGSAPTPRIVVSLGSRRACLSREMADRLLS